MVRAQLQETYQMQGYWNLSFGDTTMDHYSSAQVVVLIVDDPFRIYSKFSIPCGKYNQIVNKI